jgi:hypothetical protein
VSIKTSKEDQLMDEEKRPGGLTALAVINFIFAGFQVLSVIGLTFSMTMMDKLPMDGMTEAQKARIVAFQNIDSSTIAIMIGISIISFLLLLLSGIGYMKQKKFLGRMVGNIYAFFGIISVFISILLLPKEIGGGFGISSIIGLIYPTLTLILLDTAFKNDLNN